MIDLPETCAIAYKEWAGVCDALASGRQTTLLRKGGIAEGPGGFAPEHRVFWLYPTHVHEEQQGLREWPEVASARPPDGSVDLGLLAVVHWFARIDREEALEPLAPLHVWTEETVRKRFHYRQPGLWLLSARIVRLGEPHRIEERPEYLGCKTWVPLAEELATHGARPVLGDEGANRREEYLRSAVAPFLAV